VILLLQTWSRAISEGFRGVTYYTTKRYTNSHYFALSDHCTPIAEVPGRRHLRSADPKVHVRHSVTFDMRRLRKTLTYLLTYNLRRAFVRLCCAIHMELYETHSKTLPCLLSSL